MSGLPALPLGLKALFCFWPRHRAALGAFLFLWGCLSTKGGSAHAQEPPLYENGSSITAEDLSESRALQLLDVQTTLGAWVLAGPDLGLPRLRSVHLNLATADELLAVPGATYTGISALLRYRSLHGRFAEVAELNAVEGLSTKEAVAIAPYLYVIALRARFPRLAEWLGPTARPWLLARTQSQWPRSSAFGLPGFAPRVNYPGSPWGSLLRLRGNIPQRLSYNLVLQQDPGEPLLAAPGQPARIDYVSANAVVHNLGRLKTVILGDYLLAFGQGISMGRAFVLGRGSEPVLTLAPTSPGILPYQALVEGRALRGAAAAFSVRQGLVATAFGSAKRVDAAPVIGADSLAAGAADAVGPPRYAGLHRTPSELALRKTLPEKVGGVALQWAPAQGFGQIGGMLARQVYGRLLSAEALAPGIAQSQTYGSLWYRARLGQAALHGELALRQGVAPAFIQVLQILPTPTTGLGLQLRHLPAGAAGSYGQPIAQNLPLAGGEQGLTLSATQQIGRWHLALYQDYYRPAQATPARPFTTPIAEWALQGQYKPTKTEFTLWQLRARSTLWPSTDLPAAGPIPAGTSLQGVLGAGGQAAPWLQLSTQLRGSQVPTVVGRSTGWAAYQQARIKTGLCQLTLRAYVYDTDAWASRLVFYEPGVLFAPKAQACFGRGTRLMALVQMRMPRGAGNLYLKLARTQPQLGPATTELTLQARWYLATRTDSDNQENYAGW